MRKIKIFLYSIFLVSILSSCSGFNEVGKILRNEKIRTTDEFLVKKKEPLTEPPDFKKLPTPNSEESKNKIEKMLKKEEDNKSKQSKTSSLEDSLINKIKK